jgi:hypothetical protein
MSFRTAIKTAAMTLPPIASLVEQRNSLADGLERSRKDVASKDRLLQNAVSECEVLTDQHARVLDELSQAKGQIAELSQRIASTEAELAAMTRKADTAVLDMHSAEAPGHRVAFELFDGTWSSHIPGYGFGPIHLFEDHRIEWLDAQCGGLKGKRVLELGPLEAAHTYMLARRGAKVTAIESNSQAFLKCLTIKNAFGIDAEFLLGDFRKYLSADPPRVDILVASGVLYHMVDPVGLLKSIARATDSFLLWTHYFDPQIIDSKPEIKHKFDFEPTFVSMDQNRFEVHKYHYFDALQWKGFSGGSAPHSFWMTRTSLLECLNSLGFEVTIDTDQTDHPNGPAITLYASRIAPSLELSSAAGESERTQQ